MKKRAHMWIKGMLMVMGNISRNWIISILAVAIAICGYNLCKKPGQYALAQMEAELNECHVETTATRVRSLVAPPPILAPDETSRLQTLKFKYDQSLQAEEEDSAAYTAKDGDAIEEGEEEARGQHAPPADDKGALGAKNTKINTLLPKQGVGYQVVCTSWPNHQWGTPETIASIQRLGEEWAKYEYGPISITDISLQGGGEMPMHETHQKGVDVDININLIMYGGDYKANRQDIDNKELMRRLIKAILATGDVKLILYNDKILINEFKGIVIEADSHDSHLHVRYE